MPSVSMAITLFQILEGRFPWEDVVVHDRMQYIDTSANEDNWFRDHIR